MFKKLAIATALFAALGTQVAQAELVTNGGFETGSFASWTQFGNTGFSGASGSAYIHTGSFGAGFGPIGSTGGISQSLSTIAGEVYQFSFWLVNFSEGTNSFAVTVDGVDLVAPLVNSAAFAYTQFTGTFTAVDTSTDLSFAFRHDPSFYGLDDVSVIDTGRNVGNEVPEPGSLALLGLGLVGLAVARKRKQA